MSPPEPLELITQSIPFLSDFLNIWLLPFLKTWWWVPLPLVLLGLFLSAWLNWRQWLTLEQKEYALLEIKLPKEIVKPIKATEDIFASLGAIGTGGPSNLKEKWIVGASDILPVLSFEIAGIEGKTRFFVRVPILFRKTVESALYSHYPELEITETQDYTKFVPQDIPNAEWDLSGDEFTLNKKDKKDCYPLKTYLAFEREGAKEEHKVDPMAGLLEGLATLKKGEQVWIQILLSKADSDWIKEGQEVRDELIKRPKKAKAKSIIQEAAELLIFGPPKEKEKKESIFTPEMRLTPGEEEIIKEIERKISKQGFKTTIRAMYLAKKDVFFWPRAQIVGSFLASFNTQNLNAFKNIAETGTFVNTTFLWFLDQRRSYLRKRRMFKNYIQRTYPFFPLQSKKATSVLNTEELASIFHFPGRTVVHAPQTPRIEAKKGEPPTGLPVE